MAGKRLPIGTTIDDKYQVTGELGEGGMGVVYEGRHLTLGRQIAIKTLLPELGESSDMVGRFQQEARAASSIGHPNIVEVFDLGRLDDGTMYLVMERLQGQSLDQRLSESHSLPVADSLDIACQVLAGLGAAHRRSLVHRDLKPENIFLCNSEDAAYHIKLLDFGVSKVLKPLEFTAPNQTQIVTKTRIGSVVGTPMYMAPEQASGSPDIDPRADLWAAGVVLYEMLCGVPPFAGESYQQVLLGVLGADVVPPSQHNRDIPVELERIVLKALSKDRNQRFADAKSMRAGLLAFRDGRKDKLPTAVLGDPGVAAQGGGILDVAPAEPLGEDAFAALAAGNLIAIGGEPEPEPGPEPATPEPAPAPAAKPAAAPSFTPPSPESAKLELAYDPRTEGPRPRTVHKSKDGNLGTIVAVAFAAAVVAAIAYILDLI